MALGNSLQNIVTQTEEDAKKLVEYLRKQNLGRATFLPVSSCLLYTSLLDLKLM